MAIIFTQEKKKQKYLLFALALLLVVILLVIWRGLSGQKESLPGLSVSVPSFPEVKISWDALKDPQLEKLQLLEEIIPPEEKIGRKNPFLPR